MKTKYILTFLFTTVLILFIGCEKDLLFQKDIYQSDANPEQFRKADSNESIFSMAASSWKHADVSATDKQEHKAWVTAEPDGTVHFVFIKETKSERVNGRWYPVGWDVFYRKMDPHGQMFPITQLTFFEAIEYSHPSMAVDHLGIVHIVVQLKTSTDCGKFYLNNMGGQFSIVEKYWDPAFGECFDGLGWGWIDVDADRKVHMVSRNGSKPSEVFYYANNINGSFESKPINTAGLQSFGFMYLDVDADRKVHLTFSASENNDNNYDIYYEEQEYTDGPFSAPVLVANMGERDDFPSINIGEDGTVHIQHDHFALEGGNGLGVFYSNNSSGSFITEQVKGPGFFGAGFVLHSDNSIGIHVSENSDGILYVHNPNGFWETEVVVPPGEGQCVCFDSYIAKDNLGYVHMTNTRNRTIGKGNRRTFDRDAVYHTNNPNFQSGGGIMHVERIQMELKQKGPNWNAIAHVLILDETMSPVSGATVEGNWSGAVAGGASALTGENGEAEISSRKTKETGVTFTFTVTDVSKSGYTYDQNSNKETSDEISN